MFWNIGEFVEVWLYRGRKQTLRKKGMLLGADSLHLDCFSINTR